MTRGERQCAFIEKYCRVPEGDLAGQRIKLADFQSKFILDVYDNPAGTSRAYLSMGRKNAKTALIAALLNGHIAGPEAVQNSQIVSGARSREQASQVWNYAAKMVRQSPELSKLIREVPSSKKLIGLAKNVEYRALSADGTTNHGLSPALAILDEVGQVRGPYDDFVEAITTSQGAYDDALMIAISTQAADDGDMFSIWLDDALEGNDPHTICHLYTAPEDCELDDPEAWAAANPALGLFLSHKRMVRDAEMAKRMPTGENSFRWLHLNQRISADSPFIGKSVWNEADIEPEPFGDRPVFGGLDLAQRNDMTALVFLAGDDEADIESHFWLPSHEIGERSKADRAPYDIWAETGALHLSDGTSVNYREVAEQIIYARDNYNLKSVAYDPNMSQALWPCLEDLGMSTEEREALFHKVNQSYAGMSPGIDEFQSLLRDGKVRHGGHEVLEWHARNAVLIRGRVSDQFLLAKPKGAPHRRIDGIVACCMAAGRRAEMLEDFIEESTPWDNDPDFRLAL